jgi:uncharacterized protein YbaP (TraB family)
MFKILFLVLSLAVLTPAWAQAQAGTGTHPVEAPGAVDDSSPAPEQILVVGKRPGPGLWKITKDEHVLWVFGTYSPLPTNMEWRVQEVEAIVAQSQEYLLPPGARADIGFLRGLTLAPLAIGIKNNPNGARLRDVLPPEMYARWLALKEKYIGDDDGIERERPIFAGAELARKGLAHAGLASGREVQRKIDSIVKQNKIRMTSTSFKLEIDSPGRMIRKFKKSAMDDVTCFSKTLEALESDIDAMRVRANAWAKGDLEAIEKLNFAERESACNDAVLSSPILKDHPAFHNLQARVRESWLAAAEKSLVANKSTFAVLPMKDLLGPNSYVAALAAKGYTVQKPE